MTKAMVEGVIYWLNAFLFKSGISQTMGPSTIVLGKPAPDFSRKRVPFGAYVMGFTKTKNCPKSVSSLELSNSFCGLESLKKYVSETMKTNPKQEK